MLNDENFNITLESNVLHPKKAMLSYQAFLGRTDGNKLDPKTYDVKYLQMNMNSPSRLQLYGRLFFFIF